MLACSIRSYISHFLCNYFRPAISWGVTHLWDSGLKILQEQQQSKTLFDAIPDLTEDMTSYILSDPTD